MLLRITEVSQLGKRITPTLLHLDPGLEIHAGIQKLFHILSGKLAHFAEFTCLGLLFSRLWGMLTQKKPFLWSLLCGAAAAAIDETIQLFVPGRGPSLKDVGIDTLGVCLGIVILYFTKKQKRSKYLEENKS